jgi:hypothetical protein
MPSCFLLSLLSSLWNMDAPIDQGDHTALEERNDCQYHQKLVASESKVRLKWVAVLNVEQR